MEQKNLQWHPGFYAILQIELEDEAENLMFQNEYQLSEQPLEMDVLIVKVNRGIHLRKNFGRIFREHNIIEYKSPQDYLSINDFYKVMSYTCLYQSNTKRIAEIKPEELTITFVCSHFPRKLIRHLKKFQHIRVKKIFPGGYYLLGLMFPVQILITEQLSKEENFWLGRMRTDLNARDDLAPIGRAYQENRKDSRYQAAANLLFRANYEEVEEGKYMCDAIREIFADEIQEAELRAESRGSEEGKKAEATRYSQLILKLKECQRLDDIVRAAENPEFLQQLYQEFGFSN